jgi:CRISPR-associated endonuclease/helicase Cas3
MIDFETFYRSVHRHDPFPWQIRLANEVAANGWGNGRSIRLPTASGKTSLLDIAVFALAVQAGRPLCERTVPLRTFFVVDRRLVVDDVTRHAEKLAEALNGESGRHELSEIRASLQKFESKAPLLVTTLRGGMYRSSAWADSPNQPLICVSTVDQAGSRLLFRGYGTSGKRRPVDAGLIGCDSLIVLDEAHLSGPFVETMEAVRKYGDWAEQKQLFRPLRFVQMSATSRDKDSFALDKDDYDNETLAKRLNARKMARLREVANLEQEAATEARELAARPGINIVGVVVNTVSAARSIFEQLKGEDEDRAVLLTGRIRDYDRDKLLKRFLVRMKAGRNREADTPLYVVATQTIEVGADLDFDALISEAAPLDALRQRFGRLDRLGELGDSQAVILRRKLARGETDRVYGDAAGKTWEWLDGHADGKAGDKSIDFGARHMQELYDAHGNCELNAKPDCAPLLTPAHIETWIQTYPNPDPDPDLAPFLHGKEAGGADVNLVWRADFEGLNLTKWKNVLEIAPPLPTEALPVPIWVATKWLKRQTTGNPPDVEGSSEQSEEESPGGETQRRDFLIWRGSDDNGPGTTDLVRPGDTLILRSSEGGADEFGWNPDSTRPVADIGNECSCERVRQAGGRCVVRVHAALWFADNAENRQELEKNLRLWKEEVDDDAKDSILDLIERCYPERKRSDWTDYVDEAGNLYFTTKWLKPERRSANNLADETEEDDSESFTVPVPLKKHVDGVVEHVKSFTTACGMGDELANALATAAALHDTGKCDMRFQTLLGAANDGGPDAILAKSAGGLSKVERDRRRRVAGYPPNARHELWSVALAEKSKLIKDNPFRDLILHLIGTHHGYGRPFAPAWEEEESIEVVSVNGERLKATGKNVRELWSLGSGWVDRFARLNRTYGYWGLAYLEAILRRADCVQSREEQEKAAQ